MGPLKENPTGYGGTLWAFLSHSMIWPQFKSFPQLWKPGIAVQDSSNLCDRFQEHEEKDGRQTCSSPRSKGLLAFKSSVKGSLNQSLAPQKMILLRWEARSICRTTQCLTVTLAPTQLAMLLPTSMSCSLPANTILKIQCRCPSSQYQVLTSLDIVWMTLCGSGIH